MSTIRQHLEEIGLSRLAAAIEAQSQPSLRLIAGERGSPVVGRLGGRPNLPKGVPWPVRENRQPLSFIAQLDLSPLPQLPGAPLPNAGSLLFFYDADEQPWGFDPKDKDSSKVIYADSPLATNPPRAPHRDLDEEARFKGIALDAATEISFPPLSSGLLREHKATEEEFEAYYKLLNGAAPDHRVGGHANEVQNQLGLEAQLVSNGIYCGGKEGYEEGRKRGLDAGAADWRLLLQVDSDDRTGMMWGDLGRLYFMIHKDDLRACRFENVWLGLQCS